MKKIKIIQNTLIKYDEDCQRIVNVFKQKQYLISKEQAQKLWIMYSDTLCAGWISLPENDEHIFQYLKNFFEEIFEPTLGVKKYVICYEKNYIDDPILDDYHQRINGIGIHGFDRNIPRSLEEYNAECDKYYNIYPEDRPNRPNRPNNPNKYCTEVDINILILSGLIKEVNWL